MLHNRRSLMALFGAALSTPMAVSAAAQVNTDWKGLIWSPELALFVALTDSGIVTSENGSDWKWRR